MHQRAQGLCFNLRKVTDKNFKTHLWLSDPYKSPCRPPLVAKSDIFRSNRSDQRATTGYLKADWSWLISIIFSKPPPCQSQTFSDQRCGQAANQEPWKVVKSGFLLEIVHPDDLIKSPRVAKEILIKGNAVPWLSSFCLIWCGKLNETESYHVFAS